VEAPTLTLFSQGLLSKWGFGDGEPPDEIWNYADARGLVLDWRPILVQLVQTHLVPKLKQRVETYVITTNHNPIRARRVDGIDIDDLAKNDSIELTPEWVDVTWNDIMRAASLITPGGDPQ